MFANMFTFLNNSLIFQIVIQNLRKQFYFEFRIPLYNQTWLTSSHSKRQRKYPIDVSGLLIPGRGRRRRRIGDCYLDSIAVCSALCYPVNKYRPGINKPLTSMGYFLCLLLRLDVSNLLLPEILWCIWWLWFFLWNSLNFVLLRLDKLSNWRKL